MDLHKFALGKYFAIMRKRKGKSEANMANATFVPYIAPGVDSYANVLFTIFAPDVLLTVLFLRHISAKSKLILYIS